MRKTSSKKTVAFLTIGDPALYSTFAYISDLAQKDGIEVGTASAVSSGKQITGSQTKSAPEGALVSSSSNVGSRAYLVPRLSLSAYLPRMASRMVMSNATLLMMEITLYALKASVSPTHST